MADYRRSGYDRGHLAPAADMKVTDEVMSESFFMSNMSPQTPYFNRGIWKQLEEKVREWVSVDDTLYIVTGPILYVGLPTIGDNEVSVPKFYYKVILDYSLPEIKAIGFVLPNEKCEIPLENYVVPIDWIEAITGIDFFPNLSYIDEDQLESSMYAQLWFK